MMEAKQYLKLIAGVGRYNNLEDVEDLKKSLSNLLFKDESRADLIFPTFNARNGIYLYLKSLNLPADSNIIVQSFTCNAVVNPILWLGLQPRYVDIDPSTFNISMESLQGRVDLKTKVIIVQHTFGIPADIEKIIQFAHEKGILVLEDCAHSLGVEIGGKPLGSFGDASIVSFGLEKVLSTRTGGVLVLNERSNIERVIVEYKAFKVMSLFQSFTWLINPLLWRVLRRVGSLSVPISRFLNSLGLINFGYYKSEFIGVMPGQYPMKLSGVLARFAKIELGTLSDIVLLRKRNSKSYVDKISRSGLRIELNDSWKDIPMLKYPLVMRSKEDRERAATALSEEGIHINDWYNPVIYPRSTNLEKMMYNRGTSPKAEDISERIINLPTGSGIDEKKIDEILKIIIDSIG